jgi:peptidoglycan/xylan/chitin deacetylase (PgdA/CDA1 family)
VVSLPILTFHSLDERRSLISLSPGVFRRVLKELHESGVRTLKLSEAVESLRNGAPLPPSSFVITFDDGYRSVYEVAYPILRDLGMSAIVYLTVGTKAAVGRLPSLEGQPMLSWGEIREMRQNGIDFGAHTCTHPDLTGLSDALVEAEVRDSKDIIEHALGRPVSSFAYPFGRYDRRVRDVVRRHFTSACSDTLGLATARSDPYGLERVDTYYLGTERLLRLTSSRLLPWYLGLRAGPRRVRRALGAVVSSTRPRRRA